MLSKPVRTVSAESAALMDTLEDVRPDSSTACSAWSAHDIVAHLAAGAMEHADLIEHRLSGHPERATRGFEERELPFRALDHDTLMVRLVDEIVRGTSRLRGPVDRVHRHSAHQGEVRAALPQRGGVASLGHNRRRRDLPNVALPARAGQPRRLGVGQHAGSK